MSSVHFERQTRIPRRFALPEQGKNTRGDGSRCRSHSSLEKKENERMLVNEKLHAGEEGMRHCSLQYCKLTTRNGGSNLLSPLTVGRLMENANGAQGSCSHMGLWGGSNRNLMLARFDRIFTRDGWKEEDRPPWAGEPQPRYGRGWKRYR